MQLTDMDPARVEQNLLVNIAGPIACMRQALPLLRNGRMIFISSESVEHPFPMLSLYAAVKAAMEMLFRALRQELLSQHNIRLSVLRAGSMEGTSFSESWTHEALATFYAMAQASGELGNCGTAMPVARVVNAVEFLLSLPVDANVNLMDLRSGDAV
jgi:NAD(P)-dependent dehydrogenase (short-subunit alcohol dehydrogenase family)